MDGHEGQLMHIEIKELLDDCTEQLIWGVTAAGPSHPDGLHLESKRIENGLEAHITLPAKYCAFPGNHEARLPHAWTLYGPTAAV